MYSELSYFYARLTPWPLPSSRPLSHYLLRYNCDAPVVTFSHYISPLDNLNYNTCHSNLLAHPEVSSIPHCYPSNASFRTFSAQIPFLFSFKYGTKLPPNTSQWAAPMCCIHFSLVTDAAYIFIISSVMAHFTSDHAYFAPYFFFYGLGQPSELGGYTYTLLLVLQLCW